MGLLTRQNCSSSTTASKPGTLSPTRCMSTLSDNVRRRRYPVGVTVLGHSRIGRRSHERTFVDLGYPRTPGPTISSNLRPQQNVNRTTLSNADFKAYSRPERELTEYASMTIFIKPEVPLRIATPSEEDRTTAIGNMDRKFRLRMNCNSGDMFADRKTNETSHKQVRSPQLYYITPIDTLTGAE